VQKYLKKITLLQLAQLAFLGGVFVLPLRISSVIWTDSAWQLGFFNFFAAFAVNISELFFLLGFALLGIHYVRAQRLPIIHLAPLKKYAWPVVLLLGASAAVIPFSADPVLSLLGLWRTVLFAGIALLLAVGLLDRWLVLRVLAVALFLQAVLAIAQFAGGTDLGLQLLGESSFTSDTLNIAKVVTEAGSWVRGMGTLAHANILGGLLALGLLLLAGQPAKRVEDYVLGAVMLAGLFFTFSRAAWLAFALGMALLLIFEFRRRIVSVLAAGIIFALFAGFFAGIFVARVGTGDSSIITPAIEQGRVVQLWQSLEIIQEHPLGVGQGQYTNILAESSPELADYQLQPVHHFFALQAAEGSRLVLVAWLALFVSLIYWAYRARRYAALAVLLSALVLAQFDHYLTTSFAGQAMLWLVIGWVLAELAEGVQVQKIK